LWPRC